ncbi:unnamed protein product [Victoria cruziana]
MQIYFEERSVLLLSKEQDVVS